MKKMILYPLMLLIPFFAIAQTIPIQQSTQPCSHGDQPAFQLLIPEAKLKDIERDWTRYLKAKAKGKTEEIAGEIVMYGAVKKNIAPDGFNVFSKLLETTEGVMITAWFMRSDSAFMSKEKDSNQTLAVEKYLQDFAIPEYKSIVKGELNSENKKLSDLQNDLKGFINSEEKSNSKINENERSINRNKTQIRTNENDQKNQQSRIGKQKTVVESLKSTPGDAYKEAGKTLKEMENGLKKLVNENEKLNKQIDKWEKEIREEGRNIDQSKQDQSLKNTAIERQRAVVKSVEDKLKSIQ